MPLHNIGSGNVKKQGWFLLRLMMVNLLRLKVIKVFGFSSICLKQKSIAINEQYDKRNFN